MSQSTQSNRQAWLEEAVRQVTPIFHSHGYSVPDINISCGFPSTGQRSPRVGECWPTHLCSGGLNEIFISPILDNTEEVLGIIIHELVHAVDDCKSGHGKKFKKIATTIGLTGKMIHAHPNEDLTKVVKTIADALGPYPHKKLVITTRSKLKRIRPAASCPKCGYRVPMLKKFLEFGPPICPVDNIQLSPEGDWE